MSKELLGDIIASRVGNGETIGLGSGSTAEIIVRAIGERIRRDKLTVFGVPTSIRTALLADEMGIRVLSPLSAGRLDWAVDGADEVDDALNMIKGRGAAMLCEKIIAKRAHGRLVIVVTKEKLVTRLGERFAIPVAVIPEAIQSVVYELRTAGATEVVPRESAGKYGPAISDDGHLVLDVRFPVIVPELELRIKSITGVVESGLFVGMTPEVLILKSDGIYSRRLEGGALREELLHSGK